MWIIRKSLENGIEGISKEFKKLYTIEIKGEFVEIGDSFEIPLNAIERVQESQIEYEIRTKGIFINLSKTQKCMKSHVRC